MNYNVKGVSVVGGTSNTTELIAPSVSSSVSAVNISNVHSTTDATVTLFIQDDPSDGTTRTYKIINEVAIPAGSSLLLDNKSVLNIPFDFGLYVTVGSSDTIDIIIK